MKINDDAHITYPANEKKAIRKGVGEGITETGNQGNVWVLVADLAGSTQVKTFGELYPNRYVEVGIQEQNMAGVAAGIASQGDVAIINSFAAFSPGRNWEQIRVSVCYSNLPVIIHGSHGGLSVGEDGATHQALEDIAIMRALPNMNVVVPSDALEAKKAVLQAVKNKKPCYIRSSRSSFPIYTTNETPFEIGKANVLARGEEIAIISCGAMTYRCLEAAINSKVSCTVINMHTVKPLDVKTIKQEVLDKGIEKVLCVEEHSIIGGLGSAVCEALSEERVSVVRHGVRDVFGESASGEELLKKHGLSVEGIMHKIRDVVA